MRFVTVNLSCVQREMERERAAGARLAGHAHEAGMAAHHVIDDSETETGALRPGPGVGLDPVKLAEDLALQARRHADAAIGDADDAVAVLTVDGDHDLA